MLVTINGKTMQLVAIADPTTGEPSGGGSGSSQVEVTNFPATQAVSGPLTNAQLTAATGTAAQTAVTTDPAAAGQTMLAVMRGILAELQAQTALLQTIATNTTPP